MTILLNHVITAILHIKTDEITNENNNTQQQKTAIKIKQNSI